MRTSRYVHALKPGPLDIIGDVHGEIDALEDLLSELGWGKGDAPHPDGRSLVFVGDLVDRGPDSPAVVRRVQALVESGNAQCVLGNHELAIVRDEKKKDNYWLHYKTQRHDTGQVMPQRFPVDEAEAKRLRDFISTLPLVLFRDDLRVVHAAWVDEHVACLVDAGERPLVDIYTQAIHDIKNKLGARLEPAQKEKEAFEAVCRLDLGGTPPAVKPLAQEAGLLYQNENPIKRITSGQEARVDQCFSSNGKWRYLKRVAWWDDYTSEIPVIIGHYWRQYPPEAIRSGAISYTVQRNEDEQMLFPKGAGASPVGPNRNVWCVDFSVGRRFVQRLAAQEPLTEAHFAGRLAALRWPEQEIVFNDGERWTAP